MRYITLDCGTSTSRAYVVDGGGKIYAKATKQVGVRDTATTGSKQTLRDGVREIIATAMSETGLAAKDVAAILSSGMITSEIGLFEIPHLVAPTTPDELAAGVTRAEGVDIADPAIPVYFVRGIKNGVKQGERTPADAVGFFDFMRGEEAQVAGLLARDDFHPPAVIVILSSHTKFIPVDGKGGVLGSITTLSGQLFDAVINHTFVSKSCRRQRGEPDRPHEYYDAAIVESAFAWIKQVGLVRSLMFPRFLDVLLDTKWYERALFLDALIAAEDMLAVEQVATLTDGKAFQDFVLVGPAGRCRLYGDILARQLPAARVTRIADTEEIDALSIQGVLSLARKAGVVA